MIDIYFVKKVVKLNILINSNYAKCNCDLKKEINSENTFSKDKFIEKFDFNSYSNIRVIICYKEVFTKEDIKQFPPLYLYNMFFNYLFVLDGKELFIEDNDDKYEFQILIEIGSTKTEWKLGRIFLSKYQIIFDDDNGLIGFYTPSSKIEVIDNKKDNFFIKILIISLSVLLLLFIIFLINKKFKFLNKRKTFANELEDNFMYVPGRNNKN